MEAWGKRSKKMVTKGTGGRGKRMYKKKGMQKKWRNESKYQMENATNIQKEGALWLLLYYYY